MSNSNKYWLSPHRGLPPPRGGLASAIAYHTMGALEAPWEEEEGGRGYPAPLYLQSRAESLAQVQEAMRVQSTLEDARERSKLAFGPGAASAAPGRYLGPGGYVGPATAGSGTGYAPQALGNSNQRGYFPPAQLYGSLPATLDTRLDAMVPGLRVPFDPPAEVDSDEWDWPVPPAPVRNPNVAISVPRSFDPNPLGLRDNRLPIMPTPTPSLSLASGTPHVGGGLPGVSAMDSGAGAGIWSDPLSGIGPGRERGLEDSGGDPGYDTMEKRRAWIESQAGGGLT